MNHAELIAVGFIIVDAVELDRLTLLLEDFSGRGVGDGERQLGVLCRGEIRHFREYRRLDHQIGHLRRERQLLLIFLRKARHFRRHKDLPHALVGIEQEVHDRIHRRVEVRINLRSHRVIAEHHFRLRKVSFLRQGAAFAGRTDFLPKHQKVLADEIRAVRIGALHEAEGFLVVLQRNDAHPLDQLAGRIEPEHIVLPDARIF